MIRRQGIITCIESVTSSLPILQAFHRAWAYGLPTKNLTHTLEELVVAGDAVNPAFYIYDINTRPSNASTSAISSGYTGKFFRIDGR
jgi:hypothetical protein